MSIPNTRRFRITSPDVLHGFQIVGTNVNVTVAPGYVSEVTTTFARPGEYLVVCNEYCGLAHHNMAAVIRVTEKALAPPPPQPQLAGSELLAKYQCTACHSTDGSAGVGASFKGLTGSRRTMSDGSTLVADEAYLRESIEKPDARIVKGFEPMMPAVPIPPSELEAILEYLETLH